MRNKNYTSKQRRIIRRLFITDQSQRMSERFDEVQRDDVLRGAIASIFIKSYGLNVRRVSKNAGENYRLGLILHHSEDYKLARLAARNAWIGGHPNGRWLYAAVIDRTLLRKGKLQRFGTQFHRDSQTGEVTLFPMESPVASLKQPVDTAFITPSDRR
jgi:hypothetical protein